MRDRFQVNVSSKLKLIVINVTVFNELEMRIIQIPVEV